MKKAYRLLVVCLLLGFSIQASKDVMRFRLYLTDKHGVQPNLSTVHLSTASLQRRHRQGIQLDSTDLPIYAGYLHAIQAKGFQVVSSSKWLNTLVVSAADSTVLDSLSNLPFIRQTKLVWMKPIVRKSVNKPKQEKKSKWKIDSVGIYGRSETQVEMLGLEALHQAGFKGKGLTIALLDAGFYGVDRLEHFQDIAIRDVQDFTFPPADVYQGPWHGSAVLSLMATCSPHQFMGTAPEASYCLYRTEDVRSEFPIEEDYWVAAAEHADSLGVDILNSSVGYTEFDLPALSYKRSDLDGKTAHITQAATLASAKGMLVVVSAGNDGGKRWRKICVPADAAEVLCVGSVQSDLQRSTFGSIGPTSDGRIKPDVVAMGHSVSYIAQTGAVANGYGTSFSAPLIAGMAACIWNALPSMRSSELKSRIVESGHRFLTPDSLTGYGIPNALRLWLSVRNAFDRTYPSNFYCDYLPTANLLQVAHFLPAPTAVKLVIYNTFGEKVLVRTMNANSVFIPVNQLPNSLYLIEYVVAGVRKATQKFLIQR